MSVVATEPTRLPPHVDQEPLIVTRTAPAASIQSFLETHPASTLFHSEPWGRAVTRTFGHRHIQLTAIRHDRVVGMLPLFVIPSRLVGRRMVSVPYGVGGGILSDDDAVSEELFQEALELASQEQCAEIEFRSEHRMIPSLPTIDKYVTFTRELPSSPDDVLVWIPRKARAAIRNARDKYKLSVSFGDEHLRTVWQLYSINMRRLGSINYPFPFFEELVAQLPNHHWTCVVTHNGVPVTGLVTFLFGDRVLPYFFGATDDARRCSAANFTYFCAMKQAVREGFRVFDFGRSRKDNAGSYDFKRFHGFEPRPLQYQRWSARGTATIDLSPTNPKLAAARKLWTRMPLFVTQHTGSYLSKHIPG